MGSLAVEQEGVGGGHAGVPLSECGQPGLGGGLMLRLLTLHLATTVRFFLRARPFMGIIFLTPNNPSPFYQ